MIGIDTNILAWVFLGDDREQQHQIAQRFLAQSNKIFISGSVLLEFVWVLKSRKINKLKIIGFLEELLATGSVYFSDHEIVASAIQMYKHGRQDFGDYFLMAEARINGCTGIATFDIGLIEEFSECRSPDDF